MDVSTRNVLQLIHDLQFTGRRDTRSNSITFFDVVPEIVLFVETGYKKSQLGRELRMLETLGLVEPASGKFPVIHYQRDDQSTVKVEPGNRKGLAVYVATASDGSGVIRESWTATGLPKSKIQAWVVTGKGIEHLRDSDQAAHTTRQPAIRMSAKEANIRARDLLSKDPLFADKTQQQWADDIGCSSPLVNGLPMRKAVMDMRRREKPVQPKAVGLNEITVEQIGMSRDDQLQRLAKEQAQDDNTTNLPRKV